VVVLNKGRVEQTGTPQQVYERPETAFVHEFIGESIIVPVTVQSGAVRFGGRNIELDAASLSDGAAKLFVRPYDMVIVPLERATLKGTVKRVHGLGPAR